MRWPSLTTLVRWQTGSWTKTSLRPSLKPSQSWLSSLLEGQWPYTHICRGCYIIITYSIDCIGTYCYILINLSYPVGKGVYNVISVQIIICIQHYALVGVTGLYHISWYMLFLCVHSAVCEFVCDLIYNLTMSKIHTFIQGLVFKSVLKQEIAFFDKSTTGKIHLNTHATSPTKHCL